MAARARSGMETVDVFFKDAEGDHVGVRAEIMDGRGRLVLMVGEPPDALPHPVVPYIQRLAYIVPERKLYVNGHEATIPLDMAQADLDVLLARLEDIVGKGRAAWVKTDSIDAAAELARVRESQEQDWAEEGLTPEQIERLRDRSDKAAARKKAVKVEELDQMIAVGIPETRAKRALALCAGTTMEVALQWLEVHQEDPDLDEPVAEEKEPRWVKPLTQAEKEQQLKTLADELAKKRKEREKEEQRAVIAREVKRREEGAALQEQREEHERRLRMKAYEEKKREREEAVRAKAEVRRKLNEDRIAKGWAPLPDPEEERKKKADPISDDALAALMRPAAAASADDDWDPWRGRGPQGAAAPTPAPAAAGLRLPDAASVPLPGPETKAFLAAGIAKVKEAGPDASKKCLDALKTYSTNVSENPMVRKFRSISLSSKGFLSRVGSVPGAVELLFALGFRPDGKELFLTSLHVPTMAMAAKMFAEA
eukprot:TRINITY_DN1577_c4_g2_i1.p1 TRINITY_DN1577_c4_g2~~TRINITY_DN1577_c4_g2_i1.p1  ORF type:complete len:524 (+),score=195.49 TRINITY_DN1577_c4_g2_i1:127-1572(+)